MPNKKGRSSGKKGKANKENKSFVPPAPTARSAGTQPPSFQKMKGMLPTFHGKIGANESTVESIDGGYHKMYKEATLRFHNWMKHEACRGAKMSAVDDYRKGVDRIVDHNMKVYLKKEGTAQAADLIVAPPEIMTSLASSIRLREKVTTKLFGSKDGGDLGHRYIIDVLKYCRSSLQFGNRIGAVRNASHDDEEGDRVDVQDAIGGRFHAFTLDDDASEQDIDWEEIDRDIKDGNVPKYVGVEVEEDVAIEEVLLKGDDRFQAMALLGLMEDLMGAVHDQYVLLKDYMRGESKNRQSSSCMQLLMECAVVANAATECVNRAENEMAIDHPQLSSFSHVLALVIFPAFIADINKQLEKTKLLADPHMALQFVAEIVETSFRNGGQKKVSPIIERFVAKSGLVPKIVQETARQIYNRACVETCLELEQRLMPEQAAKQAADGLKSHVWLCSDDYIGGDCCILNTHKIIRMAMTFVPENNKRIVRSESECWAKPFDENRNPARRILGDLDQSFMTMIIPELVGICRAAPFDRLPNREHLMPVIDLFQRHVNGDRTKPVPLALTFGMHAVLTSIFVVQGHGDLDRLASCSKQSYNKLFEQMQTVTDRSKAPENCPAFYNDVVMYSDLAKYAVSHYSVKAGNPDAEEDHRKAVMLAFWNPLIAGEYMLYATYICSIGLGASTVNSVGQLKSALHLYNGLKLRDPKLDVPFLQNLDTLFKDTKAIWVGGKPVKGSCYKVFWMSFGMSAGRASRLTGSEHADNQDVFLGENMIRSEDPRDLYMRPEEMSPSYRRLVLHEFGSRNASSSEGSGEAEKHESFLADFRTRIKITHDAMGDDEDKVLPVNFSAVGSILLEFIHALSDHMGWSRRIDNYARNKPELLAMREGAKLSYAAFDMKFKLHCLLHDWGHILLSIDKDSTQLDPEYDIGKVAAFTKSFFDKVDKKRYIFFVEDKAIATVTSRNPLEVSYPYGRTGKTLDDPLQAYWSFGYSKRGWPVSRMITPGSLTPLKGPPLYFGENKLKRGSRGKYRHIASYSLAEVLDLKWDGSTYCSKTADGHPVPYIPGYDSDSEDEYEPIDFKRGMREGTMTDAQAGLYISVPGAAENGDGGPRLAQILKWKKK